MIEKYIDYNNDAREYITKELDNLKLSDSNKERCLKEVDLLYNNGVLFLIKYLYLYKKSNNRVKYHFRGMINNILLLYVLGISEVDPIKYNLSGDLCNNFKIKVDLIDSNPTTFIEYIHSLEHGLKLFGGSFEKEDIDEINEYLSDNYLIIPSCSLPYNMTFKYDYLSFDSPDILFTVEDYRNYVDDYMIVRIGYKCPILDYTSVSIENVFETKWEKNLVSKLLPKSFADYVKIKCLARGTDVWNNNQDKLFQNKLITLDNIISNVEDIFEYLISYNIDLDLSLEIANFIRRGFPSKKEYKDKWEEYAEIMKNKNCEDYFIDVCSKIKHVVGRCEAISECLYVLDENNYIELNM